MLLQLNINQFGIIEKSSIDFKNGLTVLSGETGSGKSMIFSAISQLSGQRTSTMYIRHGEQKSSVEGIFDLPKNNDLLKILEELHIDTDDELIVLKRDIFNSGKSICKVNNTTVNLSSLKIISSYLLDIHEQHDNQTLLLEKNHLSLIDSYGKNIIKKLKEEYLAKYEEYKNISEKLDFFKKNESDILQKLDFLKYQYNEIKILDLKKDEDIMIKEELDYLFNYEKINNIVMEISNELSSDVGIFNSLYNLKENVNKLIQYNSKFETKYEEINNLYYILEDLQYDISRFSNSIEYDENRLNELDIRYSKLKQLEKKYSKNVNELIAYQEELNQSILELENYDQNYDSLKNEEIKVEKELALIAEQLTNSRKEISINLENLIQDELKYLDMEKSIIKIQFKDKEYSKTGKDDIRILISTNLGEPLKSLNKVASGGELSRIMLALKIIFSNSLEMVSIIFDEIDTGISGRVSQKMAEKMYELSIKSQVLCISHLPQTTALADQNLLIEKYVNKDRTVSSIRELTDKERILEIARMISGTNTTKLSEEHAIELINISNEIKKNINKIEGNNE